LFSSTAYFGVVTEAFRERLKYLIGSEYIIWYAKHRLHDKARLRHRIDRFLRWRNSDRYFPQTVHLKSPKNNENRCFKYGRCVVNPDKEGRLAVLTAVSVNVKIKVTFIIEQTKKEQRGSKG
jgi:hypothetical protein